MTTNEERNRLSEEAHFELSLEASSHERRNRPRGLVMLAVAAVILSVIFAAYGVRARASAQSQLQAVVRNEAVVEALSAEWVQLEAIEQDPSRGRVARRVEDPISQMENLARQAGLTVPAPPRVTDEPPRGGVRLKKYNYNDEAKPITSPTLGPLFEWLRLVQTADLGMEVDALSLRPETNNWRMTVSFRRLERAN